MSSDAQQQQQPDAVADFFAGITRGARLGSVLGPVDAGAGALVGAVAELSDAAGLSRWLFGPGAEATRAQVAQAVEAATGTSDPAAQAATLERDPQATTQLRLALAQLAAQREQQAQQAQLDTLRAQLADIADARHQTVQLAQAGSVLAWGAPLVSLAVLTAYALVTTLAVWLVASRTLGDGAIAVITSAFGSLTTLASAVVAYWVGSSAGSARKGDAIEAIAARSTKPPQG